MQIIGGILLLAVLALLAHGIRSSRWYRRIKASDVAILLALGFTVGTVTHLYAPRVAVALLPLQNSTALTAAAALIICYGGAELTLPVVRVLWRPIASLSVIGVVLSAGLLGVAIWFLQIGHLSLATGLLIGAVLAGTDPAVLVSVLEDAPIAERAREMLIAESALNDPVSAIMATLLLTVTQVGTGHLMAVTGTAVLGVVISILIGLVAGWVGRRLQRVSFVRGRVSRLALVFAVAFGFCEAIGVSPFLSAFTAGLVAQPLRRTAFETNDAQAHRDHEITERFLFVVRSYIFLCLGLSFNPMGLIPYGGSAVIIAVLLVAFARPLSVAGVKLVVGHALSRKEAVFLALNRQTGVIPALFAAVLVARHSPGSGLAQMAVTASVILTSVILLPFFVPIARLCKMTVVTIDDDP